MSACVQSSSLSVFHSTPFAKSCACHVIIKFRALWSEVGSTSGRFNLKEFFIENKIKETLKINTQTQTI